MESNYRYFKIHLNTYIYYSDHQIKVNLGETVIEFCPDAYLTCTGNNYANEREYIEFYANRPFRRRIPFLLRKLQLFRTRIIFQ